MNKNNKRKGFTLIELVIVVAIIGILSLMIIPQFQKVTEDAKEKTWRSNCTTVSSAIGMYQAGNNGALPDSADDLKDYIAGGAPVDGAEPATSTYSYGGTDVFKSTYKGLTYTHIGGFTGTRTK